MGAYAWKRRITHCEVLTPHKATAVAWLVGDDLERIIETLKAKGLAFGLYDLPQLKRHGDIHEGGGTRVAWLKDPDGNIHSIVNG
jgi:hypothetical protein